MVLLDVAQQIEIPLERDVRIVPALDEDLDAAERLHFIDLRADLLVAERPSFVVLGTPVERAESAVGDADVGVIDISVDDVRDDALGMEGFSHVVRFGAELQQRSVLEPVDHVFHWDGRRRTADGGWDGGWRTADIFMLR